MKKLLLIIILIGCAAFAGGYMLYLRQIPTKLINKVYATAKSDNPTVIQLEEAYNFLDESYTRAGGTNSGEVVDALEYLTDAAGNAGMVNAGELEVNMLKKILKNNPRDWSARELMINILASVGDVDSLADQVSAVDRLLPGLSGAESYYAVLAQLAAVGSSVPWLESEALINLNKSAEKFLEKTAVFSGAAKKTRELNDRAKQLLSDYPYYAEKVPTKLAVSAEQAVKEAFKDMDTVKRAETFNSMLAQGAEFRKAVETYLKGNVALSSKEYDAARAYYSSALKNYPGLIDAKRGLAETDFQEAVSIAAVSDPNDSASKKKFQKLFIEAYDLLCEITDSGSEAGGLISVGCFVPFIEKDKFIGETYALKAGVIAALRAKSKYSKKILELEPVFKDSLAAALKYYPDSPLVKSINDRYMKEGF